MATNTDSLVVIDTPGAELLTPPGQALIRRGAEITKVMTPLLPDDMLAAHIASIQSGAVELTELEKRVLQAAQQIVAEGGKSTNAAIYAQIGGVNNLVVSS
jgi:hypothetical protein